MVTQDFILPFLLGKITGVAVTFNMRVVDGGDYFPSLFAFVFTFYFLLTGSERKLMKEYSILFFFFFFLSFCVLRISIKS